MYRVIDGRRKGKTKQLLFEAERLDAIVACANPVAMRRKALDYGLVGIECVSWSDILQRRYEKPVLIDEMELFVQQICCKQLAGYTISNED